MLHEDAVLEGDDWMAHSLLSAPFNLGLLDPAEVVAGLLAGDVDDLGERIVRTYLAVWDASPGQGPMLAMLRSAVSHEDAAEMLRELLLRVILRPLTVGAGGSDPDLRAALVASQLVGLAITRYVLRLEPVTSASADELAPLLGPTLQRYLTGQLPGPPDGLQS